MEISPRTPLQPPLLPTHVAPLQKARSSWIFGRVFYTFQAKTDSIFIQIQRWIWEKQLIEPKVHRLCYKHLLHKFLSCLILTHTLPMSTSPHIRIKNFLALHPTPSFLLTYTQSMSLGEPPCPPLSLFPLSNESLEILLHQSMASSSFKGQWEFEDELPSNWNLDENPSAQWNTRDLPSFNQRGW